MAGQYSGGCWEVWGPPQKANWAEGSDHLLEGRQPPLRVSFSLRQTRNVPPRKVCPRWELGWPSLSGVSGACIPLALRVEKIQGYPCDRHEEGTGPFKGQGEESPVAEDGEAK